MRFHVISGTSPAFPPKQAARRVRAPPSEVIAQNLGQLRRTRHRAPLATFTVFETAPVARSPAISLSATRVRRSFLDIDLSPPYSHSPSAGFHSGRGKMRFDSRKFNASSGRSAAKYITAKHAARRGPLRCTSATYRSSVQAWIGLVTRRLSIARDGFGAVHLTDLTRFSVMSPCSTA